MITINFFFQVLILLSLFQKISTLIIPNDFKILRKIYKKPNIVNTIESLYDNAHSGKKFQVSGNTTTINKDHPVIREVIDRWSTNSTPQLRNEKSNSTSKVALCIEGGGMRGCVNAGALAAMQYLGLDDSVDIVYGSSAGSLMGAYFISKQDKDHVFYSDIIRKSRQRFINKLKLFDVFQFYSLFEYTKKHSKRLLNPISLIKNKNQNNSVTQTPTAKVLDLDFLLENVMNGDHKLNWDSFVENEKYQPMKIITSSLNNMSSMALSKENGNYNDLPTLMKCLKASMLAPGLTGGLLALSETKKCPEDFNISQIPVQDLIPKNINTTRKVKNQKILNPNSFKFKAKSFLNFLKEFSRKEKVFQKLIFKPMSISRFKKKLNTSMSSLEEPGQLNETSASNSTETNNSSSSSSLMAEEIVPVADAFLCEPIPYKSAMRENASHIIVLRSKPDFVPHKVSANSYYEIFIAKNFFRKLGIEKAFKWFYSLAHHIIYAEDILRLNQAAAGPIEGINVENKTAHILPIAVISSNKEINQLETRADFIDLGMELGARRVLQLFLPIMLAKESLIDKKDNNLQKIKSSLGGNHSDESINQQIDSILLEIFPEKKKTFNTLI